VWGGAGLIIFFFSVIFVTVLERKFLGFSQIRMGPLKRGFSLVFQALLDGVKLLMKNMFLLTSSLKFYFYFIPSLLILVCYCFFILLSVSFGGVGVSYWGILFLCFLGVLSYYNIVLGSIRNNIYSVIGGLRSMAQALRFEICVGGRVIMIFSLYCSISIFFISEFLVLFVYPLLGGFVCIVCFLEFNRIPFDYSERESELVSGFNVEFGSSGFVIIFVGEYIVILLLSMMFTIFILKLKLFFVIFLLVVIFVRAVFPRVRVDLIFYKFWKERTLFISIYFFCRVLG
jgi:NADH:ubiquinone oxidoreductase subunit H